MKTDHIHASKIKPLAQIIAGIIKANPATLDKPDMLMALLEIQIPKLKDRTKCINCGASMAEYLREIDIFQCLLVMQMARIVEARVFKGMTFTDANKINVNAAKEIIHQAKNVTGNAGKLGLIAKVMEKGERVGALWAVTKRGYALLRGDKIPKRVRVFRGQILEHYSEMTTMQEVLTAYDNKIRELEKKGKHNYDDVRSISSGYNQNDWVQIAGYNQGELL